MLSISERSWLYKLLFLLLLSYLILRAFFVKPYVDEVYTLFHFIESDTFIEDELGFMSANNHLFNTFLGKFIYSFNGDNFFFLRIPNIIAFVFFFVATKKIVVKHVVLNYQFLTFLALNTVAWIFEYFGYLRGYGIALAFLFGSILFLSHWITSRKPLHFIIALLFLVFSLFSNLSFFNSVSLLFSYSVLYFIYHLKNVTKKEIWIYFSVIFTFLSAIIPLVKYSFDLKNAGSLWWGNLSGIWKCTGSSLSNLTFFSDSGLIKHLVIAYFLFYVIFSINNFVRKGFYLFVFSFEGLIFTLLIGNIFIISLLAILFEVNYPHDRAAIQIVLFTILSFVIILEHFKSKGFLIILLLYFPISFIYSVNLDSSIYQKDHRLKPVISDFLNKKIQKDESYTIGSLLYDPRMFELRKEKQANLFIRGDELTPFVRPTYLIINKSNELPKNYFRITEDIDSKISILKDKNIYKSEIVLDTLFPNSISSEEFWGGFSNRSTSIFEGSDKFKFKVTGEVKFTDKITPLNITFTLGDSIQPNKYYVGLGLEAVANEERVVNFIWNSPIFTVEKEMCDFSLYFWNLDKQDVIYENIHIRLYKTKLIR